MDSNYAALSRYESFKSDVNNIIGELNKAIQPLESIVNSFDNSFVIDDNRADNNKLTEFYNSLVKQRSFLNNTCIPSINNKIARIKAAIEEAERLERETLGLGVHS